MTPSTKISPHSGADSRDMIGAHISYRREFGALPRVVGDVAPGDTARATVVAAHVRLLIGQLHGHHASEDDGVWPRLHERCPAEVQPLIAVMEQQHDEVDKRLRKLEATTERWAADAGERHRDAVVSAAADLLSPLYEHLDLEEEKVLPLIDTYLSQQEWEEVVRAGVAKVPRSKLLLIMGLTLYDADPEMQELMSMALPSLLWPIMSRLGRRAYAVHAKRVYGTPTPDHWIN
ncbi:hemerythrin domain-containing protein [Streptomyces sp. NPDC057062]|uniref:hemerythrin domain-containing protein n=1 Tax=Streptomyces sp. NPDC057062 TaxID=3346011 RepID=UPI003644ED50